MRCPRIGVACPIPAERAALVEWLSSGGFEPIPLLDGVSIGRAMQAGGFEALVIDAALLNDREAAFALRLLGSNRPLLVIGEPDPAAQADAERRDATYLVRPVTRDMALLAMALALAEGRPARRSRRQPVARIPATVDTVPATLIDVSYEGVRLELGEQHRAALQPYFKIQVPLFRVAVVAQRVWVGKPASPVRSDSSIWCGASLDRNARSVADAWRTVVDQAPMASATLKRI
jgi:hypothetical protein